MRDLTEIVDLAFLMRKESVFKLTARFDPEAVCMLGARLIADPDGYLTVAKNEKGLVIGFIAGQLAPYIFSPSEKHIVDYAVFVEPSSRGGSAAYRLMKDFEEWGKDKDALEMTIGVSTGVEPQKIHEFYKKLGYACVGGLYKKNLKET